MNKKKLLTLIVAQTFFWLFVPLTPVSAQVPPVPGFGGLINFDIPCTCPGTIGNLWIWHTPLFLTVSPSPLTGPLAWSPFYTIHYPMYFFGVPGSYDLGAYIPGVQACWLLIPAVPPFCIPLVNIGLMTQEGTSPSI